MKTAVRLPSSTLTATTLYSPHKLSSSYSPPPLPSYLIPSTASIQNHFAAQFNERESKLRFAHHCQSTVGVNSDNEPTLQGGVVALGKFDALHIGHRELAIQASKAGIPFLLSFVGMAEVFGWEPRVQFCKPEASNIGLWGLSFSSTNNIISRAPIVAKCDRKRVLASWAPYCGSVSPSEIHVEFSSVRHLSPRQFVEKLAKELGVCGVVAGENYRFGYKAAGDASELVKLCEEYDIKAYIVGSVMDKKQLLGVRNSLDSKDKGQVSSTRVRRALAVGDIKYVSELLGRTHRLMFALSEAEDCIRKENSLSAPKSCLLNLPPKEGLYENCNCFIGDTPALPCTTVIDTTHIHVMLNQRIPFQDNQLVGVEFCSVEEV